MSVAIVRKRTPAELAECFAERGLPTRRLAGGYIDDLASLGKCVWLCGPCSRKFNAKVYDYVTRRSLPFVRGNCDGCRQYTPMARMFAPRFYDHVPRGA